MSFSESDKLSIATIFSRFWKQVTLTWGLTLVETAALASMPLVIGWAIDGLLNHEWNSFLGLVLLFVTTLFTAITRRVYDTRVYGTMRAEMGKAQAERSLADSVSVTNARVLMGRELVDFLEIEAPVAASSLVQVFVSVIILLVFHPVLAISAGSAALAAVVIYSVFSKLFFQINRQLNEQAEQQIQALETKSPQKVAAHFFGMRRNEVRLSDAESLVYGLIFAVLLAMLGFNLWFAAAETNATTGNIFAIVTYSLEFMQSSVALPAVLQSLTRLKEITGRINEGV